jgi:hypothetical protein
MREYVRPDIAEREFRDAAGAAIPYGSRWGGNQPPENTYSVSTHPQRFAPLHAVAEALVEYLAATYRVHVTEEPAAAVGGPGVEPARVVRAVRLVPDGRDAAPLTVVLTSYPSVLVRAGLLHVLHYPDCGCDACDEDWASQAGEMEWQLRAVADGHFREFVREGAEVWFGYSIGAGGDKRQGGSAVAGSAAERARVAEAVARGLPARWAPWPRR